MCVPPMTDYAAGIFQIDSLNSRKPEHTDTVGPDRRAAPGPQVHTPLLDGPLPAAVADPAWVGGGGRTGQAVPRLLSHPAASTLGTNHVSIESNTPHVKTDTNNDGKEPKYEGLSMTAQDRYYHISNRQKKWMIVQGWCIHVVSNEPKIECLYMTALDMWWVR